MKKYLDDNGLLYLIQKIKGWLSYKVDKVDGKGLSTNDYTTAEKNKLSGISAGAEANVNADWNSASGDSQILNKPFNSIGAGLSVTGGVLSADGGGVADSVDWENVVGRPENISYFNNDINYANIRFCQSLDEITLPVEFTTLYCVSTLEGITTHIYVGPEGGYIPIALTKEELNTILSNYALKSAIPTNNNQLTNGAGYQTAADVETAINSKLSSVLKYKGTVANYSDLPANAQTGDTYNITNASSYNNAGDNAAWNGSDWDILSGTIDLSGYVETDDLVSITNAEIDTICA